MSDIKLNIGGVDIDVKQEDVSKAIETGKLEIQSDELIINKKSDEPVIYTKDEFDKFKTNLSNDEYKKGKEAGEEMLIKAAKETFKVDFEGKKFDDFAKAYGKKVLDEAKIEPNKKIEELESDKHKLHENYQALEQEFNQFKTTIAEKETRVKKDNDLMKFIPDTGLKVNKSITLLALKNEGMIDLDYNENNPVILEKGSIVKDEKTLQPVDPSVFIADKLKSLDLIASNGGGGGHADDPGGGAQTGSYEKFVKEMVAQGIDEGSEKFNIEMNRRIKENTLKM